MENPWAAEVGLGVNGEKKTLRLTLGVLAELEAELGAESLVDLISRFEGGSYRASDLIGLITAGLRGGGWEIGRAEIANARFDLGLGDAAAKAARALALSFAPPDQAG